MVNVSCVAGDASKIGEKGVKSTSFLPLTTTVVKGRFQTIFYQHLVFTMKMLSKTPTTQKLNGRLILMKRVKTRGGS